MLLLCVVFAQVNLGQDSREKKDEKTKVCVCVCVCTHARVPMNVETGRVWRRELAP